MRVALLVLALSLGACGDADPAREPAAEGDAGFDGLADRGELSEGVRPGFAALEGFVGRSACVECHQEQAELYAGSHHDLAMAPASDQTVLGDFASASFTHFGLTSRFFRRGEQFWVNTEGPDGQAHDYQVDYTFGVFPLQQYLVPFPGGRLQVLPLCWDSRPADDGGQRWFQLYPDEEIPAGDVLHWTGPNQNWNYQCAECHSTGLRRQYREASDDYATVWTEIDVSCEACHGPGAAHLEWARQDPPAVAGDRGLVVSLKDSNQGLWEHLDDTGIAARSAPRSSRAQSETCARCHGRRSLIAARHGFGRPLLDNQLPSLLEEGLYYADGQPLEEVYVHGSFLQSPMHGAGVSCSDCHDPHALNVRGAGNSTCAGCHDPQRFDQREHHHHEVGSDGAACVSCHMPSTTYMVVDERRDHRFSVPRPDLSEALDSPNACNGCHSDQSASWAADAALEWWGADRRATPHYGEVLQAGRRGAVGSSQALAQLVRDDEAAAVVRASALILLAESPAGLDVEVVAAAAGGAALLRMAAARVGDALSPAERWGAVGPLLTDELLAVRIEAGRVLAGLQYEGLDPAQLVSLDDVLVELRQAQHVNAERPESQLNLGLLAARLGDWSGAESAYLQGLRLGPDYQPLAINLSDLSRHLGREEEGLAVLQEAQERDPASPLLHHARGLALIRLGRHGESLSALQAAAQGDPQDSRFAYVWAVALASAGQLEKAVEVLAQASAVHPTNRELLFALATYRMQSGALGDATGTARRLLALDPSDQATLQLLASLKDAAESGQ
ncbi:MAG: Flp pilus assembly protein TadD [Pseudohongiellaceae bacterium]|jgi:Flp pilus assembly protein TadD